MEFDRLDKNKDGMLSKEEFAARGKAGASASTGKSSSATPKSSSGASSTPSAKPAK
jgi:hypothetical protein